MKKIIRLSTLMLTSFLVANSASAAGTIAVLDVNRILSDSKAAKGLNDQMNNLRKEYEKKIYKKEEALRNEERKFESLKGAELEKARKNLEKNLAEFQKSVMIEQNKLQRAAQEAMDKIREKVVNISNEVAKSKDFVYVQPAAGFLYFPAETDITAPTIARLDKDLPEVKVVVKDIKAEPAN